MKRAKRWRGLVCGLALGAMALGVVAGCPGSDRDERPDGGWTFRDGGEDTTPDGGGPGEEPHPVDIGIVNDSSQTVYIQPVKNCRSNPPGWLTLQKGGNELTLADRCGMCTCEERRRGDRCAGPCPGACAVGELEPVDPSERKSWQWSGTYFSSSQVDGESCQARTIPTEGTEITAEVCWGARPEGEDGVPRRRLDDPTCETVRFEYGKTDSVEVVVEEKTPTGEPVPTKFVLKNESNRKIRVRPSSQCEQRAKEWLRLWDVAQDGRARVDIDSWCGECSCESVEDGGGCAVCGAACVRPSDRVLRSGESVSLKWEGRRYRQERVDGSACVRESVPASGKTFVADICWWEMEMTTGGMEPSQTCESIEFAYGEDGRVTHTVEPKQQDGPVQTDFILKNGSGKEVRIQKGAGCGVGWIGFPGSSIPAADGACSVCTCETVKEQGGCPLCGACRPPYIEALGDGELVRVGWNGYTYKKDTVDGRTCDRKQVPRRGQQFQVEYCWSTKSGPTGSGELGDQTCTTETFRYGDKPTVHTIK